MICLIALIVFGILGIFSAYYRKLALEALDCVFRRVTLRKCESGLDKRIKSRITGKFMERSPGIAGFIYKYFEAISWFFTILLIASIVFSGIGIYNYVKYGNCNGPESIGFCIFDPTGANQISTITPAYAGSIVWPGVDNGAQIGPDDAPVTIIEFGCFKCQYTKKAEATRKQIISTYGNKVRFVYRDFPLNQRHVNASELSEAARCAGDQGAYWQYHDLLFDRQGQLMDVSTLENYAAELNLNQSQFNYCLESGQHKEDVIKDFEDGQKAGVLGTPTFFIGSDVKIVGPKPFGDFKKAIDSQLKK